MRDIKDYSNKYVEEPFESTMVEIRKKMVVNQCLRYPHKNILEIGCGMNPFFLDFSDYDHMVIVDPSERFTDHARKSAENKNIHVIKGFLEQVEREVQGLNVKFDFIILSSLIHELDDPQNMLKSVSALCDKETVVHINVPNANSFHRLIAKEMGMIKDVHAQSLQMQKMQRRRTYDMDSLCEEVENAGFSILDKGSYFVKPFTHAQMQECIDKGIIGYSVIEGLEKMIKYMPQLGAGIYVNVIRQ